MPIESFLNRILCGNASSILQQLPDKCIDCVVTSPPYWSLRDYGVRGQLGLENSIGEYLARLLAVFDEVKRVLKDRGTCWVILGDTYASDSFVRKKAAAQYETSERSTLRRGVGSGLQKKCLAQVPARFAIRMIGRNWLLRNEIIWHKPNCMPSSARDRFTVDYEKLFFFTKNRRYYFKQQFEPLRGKDRLTRPLVTPEARRKRAYGDPLIAAINPNTEGASRQRMLRLGRNKRCVWRIPTRPFAGNHFAVFPPGLVEIPIKAGCPPKGIMLDPFIGSGTAALVAKSLGRSYIGIDINPEYVRMAQARLVNAPSRKQAANLPLYS